MGYIMESFSVAYTQLTHEGLYKDPLALLKRIYTHFVSDSLYRNSIYLMLSTGVMAFFGFFFWIINARFYTPESIGVATSIISAASLTSVFCTLGFNNTYIRFLSTSAERNKLITTGVILTAIASFIFSIFSFLWILHAQILSTNTYPIISVFLLFISYVFLLTFSTLLESIFIARRVARYVFLKNFLLSFIKIILPIFLVSLGTWGVIASVELSIFASLILGCILLFRNLKYKPVFRLDIQVLKQTKRFTLGNYIGNIFGVLPTTLIPIIVVAQLGSSNGAYYYMPLMIVGFLNVIPSAASQSLLAEASHNEQHLGKHLTKAILHIYLILIPLAVLVIVFSASILSVFGANYALKGTMVLQLLAIASVIGAANYIGDTLLNIKKRSSLYVFMNAFNSILIVVLVLLLASKGLIWVAYASLLGQALTLVTYIILNRKQISSMQKLILSFRY